MSKKVLTLLPIFSMFALASCGGAGGGTQYCLVDFDSDGGTHVTAMKVAQGTKIEKGPDNPTKAGYEFDCWLKDGTEFSFPATINEDITLKAKWGTETEEFEDMKEQAFKDDINANFNVGSITTKYVNTFVVITREGSETFKGMIEKITSDTAYTGTYYFDYYNSTYLTNVEYHLLNSSVIAVIRSHVDLFSPRTGNWAYKKGDKGSRLITYVVDDGSVYNFSFLFNSDFVPVKIIEKGNNIAENFNFTYIL